MNHSELADELGILRKRQSKLQKREKEIREVLLESKKNSFTGTKFIITIKNEIQERLNTTLIRSSMSKKWIIKYTSESTRTILTCTPLKSS